MPFVDFKALKASVTIEQVVTLLGLKMHQESNQLRGVCPVCKTLGERELVVTPSKAAFYCFGTRQGGDLIALASHIKGVSPKDAAQFIIDGTVNVQVPSTPVPVTSTATTVPTKGFDRAKYQATLDREHELLKDVPKDFCERADIGVSNKGSLKGIVIPCYDKGTGEFMCYAEVTGIRLPSNVIKLRKSA